MKNFIEHKITFHRDCGHRMCRIVARPLTQRFSGGDRSFDSNTPWSLYVVGDFIPTIDNQVVDADQIYAETGKILTDWYEIAEKMVLRQFPNLSGECEPGPTYYDAFELASIKRQLQAGNAIVRDAARSRSYKLHRLLAERVSESG